MHSLSNFQFLTLNICISVVPLFFALFYPKVGTILGYAASISGFFMIYVVPVMAYMKMRKIEILHPELAAAIQQNEVQVVIPQKKNFPMQSPKSGDDIVEGSTGGGNDMDP
jgi:MFS-type transporter involved in bile tolerance (Atg22 family)